jgi:hypothetical protein
MKKMKKWVTASFLVVAMLLLSLANVMQVAFAEGNTATLVVVGDSEKGAILCPKKVEIQPGESALDVLKQEFPGKVITEQTSYGESLIGIDGLETGKKDPKSYWYFELNGEMAQVGSGSYQVQNQDVIAFRYVQDWDKGLSGTLIDDLKTLGTCNPVELTYPNAEKPPVTTEPAKPQPVQGVDAAIEKAAQYILKNGIGSEWQAIGLMRSGVTVPEEVKKGYLQTLSENVQNKRMSGTTLARTILAVNAMGGDPTHFAGKNLIEMLYNDSRVNDIYSYAYALIALDSRDYEIPKDALWSRERLQNAILSLQNSEGSWAEDADTNSMALMALAPYAEADSKVGSAVIKAIDLLKNMQTKNGGFEAFGSENANSVASVITALSMIGVDPAGEGFTKDKNAVQNLLSFQLADGGFKWKPTDEKNDNMALEQSLYALLQYKYFLEGKGSIFHWDKDLPSTGGETENPPTPSTPTIPSTPTSGTSTTPAEETNQAQPTTEQTAVNKSAAEKVTETKAPAAKSAEKKQTLPDTAMFGPEFWSMLAAGIILVIAAVIVWKRKTA